MGSWRGYSPAGYEVGEGDPRRAELHLGLTNINTQGNGTMKTRTECDETALIRGLVHAPALAHGALAAAEYRDQRRHDLQRPAMHGCVIDEHSALGHYLLDVTQAQGVRYVQRTQVSITSNG